MALSRRYEPAHPPGEKCSFGLDFSPIIPPGVGIASGALAITYNDATGADAAADWTMGAVAWRGRALYAELQGGVAGKDYALTWTATDSDGNVWPRTTLCLCAPTS